MNSTTCYTQRTVHKVSTRSLWNFWKPPIPSLADERMSYGRPLIALSTSYEAENHPFRFGIKNSHQKKKIPKSLHPNLCSSVQHLLSNINCVKKRQKKFMDDLGSSCELLRKRFICTAYNVHFIALSVTHRSKDIIRPGFGHRYNSNLPIYVAYPSTINK